MTQRSFQPFDQVQSVFERVLASSVADETELVWFERQRATASYPNQERVSAQESRVTVLVRVVEGGRQGWYRTEVLDGNQLESGIRHALALSKVQDQVKRRPVLPTDKRIPHFPHDLLDPEVAELDRRSAAALLERWCGEETRGRLRWSETHLAVFNNHGLRRSAASTELTFEAAAGTGPGEGRAASSARGLEDLRADEVCGRAVRGRSQGEPAEAPSGAFPVLLAPAAVTELLNLLNTFAFSARAYLEGSSFLARHRGDQVFDRVFNLRDDGSRKPGVPFPFDVEGSVKKPLDLIVNGQPSTPALNLYQGAKAGLRPTAQAVGGQDSLFGNLFMLPGEAGEEELLAAADGGIRVGWLDPPECYDPSQLKIRARCRGVCKIENGRPGPPLPDLVWEESLLRVLARLSAVGRETVVRATPTTPFGAISTPAIVLTESEGFRTAG